MTLRIASLLMDPVSRSLDRHRVRLVQRSPQQLGGLLAGFERDGDAFVRSDFGDFRQRVEERPGQGRYAGRVVQVAELLAVRLVLGEEPLNLEPDPAVGVEVIVTGASR